MTNHDRIEQARALIAHLGGIQPGPATVAGEGMTALHAATAIPHAAMAVPHAATAIPHAAMAAPHAPGVDRRPAG